MHSIELIEKLKNINDIVAICKFGSHGTEYWVEGRSDIDIAVVVNEKISFMDTLNIEDKIISISKEYYNYDDIHLTFLLFNDFNSKYARMAIDSNEQYVVDENKWYDFRHYVLKYSRNNRDFERMLKIDEQYSYFGGVIDESLL